MISYYKPSDRCGGRVNLQLLVGAHAAVSHAPARLGRPPCCALAAAAVVSTCLGAVLRSHSGTLLCMHTHLL